jgi:hypothetical protein
MLSSPPQVVPPAHQICHVVPVHANTPYWDRRDTAPPLTFAFGGEWPTPRSGPEGSIPTPTEYDAGRAP